MTHLLVLSTKVSFYHKIAISNFNNTCSYKWKCARKYIFNSLWRGDKILECGREQHECKCGCELTMWRMKFLKILAELLRSTVMLLLLDIITWRTSVVLISQQSRNYLVVIWFVIGLSTRIVHKVLDANFWEETVVINLGRDQVRRICWTVGNFKIDFIEFRRCIVFQKLRTFKKFSTTYFCNFTSKTAIIDEVFSGRFSAAKTFLIEHVSSLLIFLWSLGITMNPSLINCRLQL